MLLVLLLIFGLFMEEFFTISRVFRVYVMLLYLLWSINYKFFRQFYRIASHARSGTEPILWDICILLKHTKHS